jgi:uncharacterized membrane protein
MKIIFDSPWFLLLLLVLPVLWVWSYRSLAGLGKVRRIVALGLRTLVMLLLIFAVANMRLLRTSEKLTVIYLLDQSASIPKEQREAMADFARESVAQHRDASRKDRAAVVVFGRKPDIEVGPIDADLPLAPDLETEVDPEFTDLESAMTMARAMFTEDAAKRVVIITDGNENLGDAIEQAHNLANSGIGIDVLPIHIGDRADVSVEKVTIPADVRQGQPFDLRVVLNNNSDQIARGKVKIVRKAGARTTDLGEYQVELPPGKTVISTDKGTPETIRRPDFYTYEAIFTAAEGTDNAQRENDRATTFTHVRGRGQVLVIEDRDNAGQFDDFVDVLRQERLAVTVMPSDELFTSLAELQRYDTVILANVPRAGGGGDEDEVRNFSDDQISILVRNTEQMGSGLVMLGGPNSFGAGGWTNTEIEKAMPVDFQIDNAKIAPVGALCLLMHAGEMANGNHWQRVIAQESIKALGNQDYCALLQWDWQMGGDGWLWDPAFAKIANKRKQMLALLDRMTPGDMPEFGPGMRKAGIAFTKVTDAATKHMIIISDGDPTPPLQSDIDLFTVQTPPVVISTVLVDGHGQWGAGNWASVMRDIADQTGGKFYRVSSGRALPRIYQREVRRFAKPLIYQSEQGFVPLVRGGHEIIHEIESPPPLNGFILTTLKDDPLVEVSMLAPPFRTEKGTVPEKNRTLLASWNYGLGRTVAFTSDTGETSQAWARQWRQWDDLRKLFSKIVRWSMRPVDEKANFMVATDVTDGKVKVMINAWDKDDEYLDFLNMTGTVVGPDNRPLDITVKQVAPGRYVGEFDAMDAGSYMVLVNPGRGGAPIRTGVNVPYSAEYRDRMANLTLLQDIAAIEPEDGKRGIVMEDVKLPIGDPKFAEQYNSFRHNLKKASSREDVWYLLLFAASCLFFFDVFFRRVQVSFAWIGAAVDTVSRTVFRREPVPVASETMARLRGRKAEVSGHIEQRRAAARFEPSADAPVDDGPLEDESPSTEPQKPAETEALAPESETEENTYTSRLLKAKKKVWENRDKQ